jgi:hypothetical protein
MFDSIGNAWTAVKDGALESAAKFYLNQKIDAFGQVTRVELDRKLGRVFIEVELKGESLPVSIEVGRYEVRQNNGVDYLTVREVSASREWLGIALNQYVVGREFRLPASMARFAAPNQ